jgi:hypothetical protein
LLLPQAGQYQILGSGFIESNNRYVLQTLHAHDHSSDEAGGSVIFNLRDLLRFFRSVAQHKYNAAHNVQITNMRIIST